MNHPKRKGAAWTTRKLAWHWLLKLQTMTANEIRYVCECSAPQAHRIMQQLCDIELAVFTLEGKTVCITVNRNK